MACCALLIGLSFSCFLPFRGCFGQAPFSPVFAYGFQSGAKECIRTLVPGYSFDADALFEEPDAKRQSELMEAVYAAKEAALVDGL